MPIPLRVDFDAVGLRAAARQTKDAAQARRLLALAAIYEGASYRLRVISSVGRVWATNGSQCAA